MATRKRSPAEPAHEQPAHPKASAKGSRKAPAPASRRAAEPAPTVADRPPEAAPSTPPPADRPATAPPPGTEALQAAALQVIGAARAFLEVAERAVQDPQVLGQVATVAGAVAKGVLGSLGSLAAGSPSGGQADPPIEHIDLG